MLYIGNIREVLKMDLCNKGGQPEVNVGDATGKPE